MSTRGVAVRKLLAQAKRILASGRGHLLVIGDRETTSHLPRLLAEALRGQIDSVTVPLAGSRETVSDCLTAAIREARLAGPGDGAAPATSRQQLALMVCDALSIPTFALRSLHDIASLLGSHRLILFVDRDATPFRDPAEELITRIGVSIAKLELEEPTLRLQSEPDPTPTPPRKPRPRPKPAAVAPEPDATPSSPSDSVAPAPEPRADLLPRFAEPVVIAPPKRVDLKTRRRTRRRGRFLRGSLLAAIVVACLASPGLVRHGPAVPEAESSGETAPIPATAPVPGPPSVVVATHEPEPTAPAPPTVPAPAPTPAPAAVPAPAATAAVPVTPAPVAKPAKPVAKVARAAKRAPVAKRSTKRARPVAPPPITVLVNFNAAPWAELEVDGRDLGPTPLGKVPLAAGSHVVRATFPDGRVVRRTIQVDERRRRFEIR